MVQVEEVEVQVVQETWSQEATATMTARGTLT